MHRLIVAALALLPTSASAQVATNPMFDSVNGVRSVIHADPTGVNDSAPAINAALAADAQGNFHNVYLPVGVYKLKSPITITGNQIGMLGGSGTALSMTDAVLNRATSNMFGPGFTFTAPGPAGSYEGTQWATYVPTVTCSSGALTAYTATAAYQRIGKQMQIIGNITLTTLGTCSGIVQMSLPLTAPAISTPSVGFGRENAVTGWGLQITTAGSALVIVKYDGTALTGAGYQFEFSINYSTQ